VDNDVPIRDVLLRRMGKRFVRTREGALPVRAGILPTPISAREKRMFVASIRERKLRIADASPFLPDFVGARVRKSLGGVSARFRQSDKRLIPANLTRGVLPGHFLFSLRQRDQQARLMEGQVFARRDTRLSTPARMTARYRRANFSLRQGSDVRDIRAMKARLQAPLLARRKGTTDTPARAHVFTAARVRDTNQQTSLRLLHLVGKRRASGVRDLRTFSQLNVRARHVLEGVRASSAVSLDARLVRSVRTSEFRNAFVALATESGRVRLFLSPVSSGVPGFNLVAEKCIRNLRPSSIRMIGNSGGGLAVRALDLRESNVRRLLHMQPTRWGTLELARRKRFAVREKNPTHPFAQSLRRRTHGDSFRQ
jgi:hypothetical protein